MRSLIVTDLDGTILPRDGAINPYVIEAFRRWRNQGHVVAIATGRNFLSARKALALNLPVDLIVFSSGQGLASWPSQKLTTRQILSPDESVKIANCLADHKLCFMQHAGLPNSHRFRAFCPIGAEIPADFERRLTIYQDAHLRLGCEQKNHHVSSSQFIAILGPTTDPDATISLLANDLPEFSIVRATSPLDDKSHWIEIFPNGINKSSAAEQLRQKLTITHERTFAIGNDWNDLSMLEWAHHAWVVPSAPDGLSKKFTSKPLIGSNSILAAIDQMLR